MEDISSMTAKDVLNRLRTFKQYENENDYYIKKTIGGKKTATVSELRKELIKLSSQNIVQNPSIKSTDKNIKLYNINNKNYTEDDLIKMIQFYEDYHVKPVNLPTDVLYEIMLNSNFQTIINYCQTNKDHKKICDDNQFWIKKFNTDHMPFLYHIPKENVNYYIKNDDSIKDYIKYEPSTYKEWIKLYRDTILYMDVATQFVDLILETNQFTEFYTPEINFYDYVWLPTEWFKNTQKLDDMKIYNTPEISYHVIKKGKNVKYEIRLIYKLYDENLDLTNELLQIKILSLTKKEFIINLAQLFYYQSHFDPDELFIVNMEDEFYVKAFYIGNVKNNNIKEVFED
jgi:hypothetical protein